MHNGEPTHHSSADNLAAQTRRNAVSRRTENVKMISPRRSQMLLIIRWTSGVSGQDFLPAFCCTPTVLLQPEMHFLLCLVTLMVCLSPSLPLSFFLFLPLSQFPRQMTTPVSLLLNTQSGQTSKYTTLVSDDELLKTNSSQLPVAGQYLAAAAEPSFVCRALRTATNHLLVHCILWLGKENPQVIAG